MGASLPLEQRRVVEALLQEGLSDVDVARRTGVSRKTVARYRKRLGLPGFRVTVTADSPACGHGHPFPENVAQHASTGWLYCRECRRIRDQARYGPAEPDEAAVLRAVAGDPPKERHAAIAQLDRRQLSAAVIAERVRCSRRTVHRARGKTKV